MNSFYEKIRDDEDLLRVHRNGNHNFPSHFHNSMEILLVRKGGYEVFLNEKRYEVTDGCVFVIDSYDIHSFQMLEKDQAPDDCVLIIPYKYLDRFNARRKNFRIENPILRDEKFCSELMRLADELLSKEANAVVREAAIGLFLAMLGERLSFTESVTGDERVLVRKILGYIQENYRGEATRASIARALGYTEAHISRVFHRYIRTSISEYVNGLRIKYIERLRAEGDDRTTIELIYESGFKSQQTYYRVRKRDR